MCFLGRVFRSMGLENLGLIGQIEVKRSMGKEENTVDEKPGCADSRKGYNDEEDKTNTNFIHSFHVFKEKCPSAMLIYKRPST